MKTMKTIICAAFIAVIGLGYSSTEVNAQDSGNLDVKAEVFANLTFNDANKRDLQFSSLSQGIAKTIAANGAGTVTTAGPKTGSETSGRFEISGPTNGDVSIRFTTIPANLDEDGTGTATMPVTYTSNYHVLTGGAEGTATTVAVTANTATRINGGLFPAGGIRVYLGGTVTPGESQTTGSYTTTVTLQAIFN
jgi:hypothetical protein